MCNPDGPWHSQSLYFLCFSYFMRELEMTNDVSRGRYFLNICAMDSLMLFFSFSHSCLWWVIARAWSDSAPHSNPETSETEPGHLNISLMKTLVTRQAGQGACSLQNTWFMRFSLDLDSHLRHRSRPLLSRAPKLKLTLEAKEHFRGRIMFSFHSTFHVAGKSELRNVYTLNFAASNIPIVNSLYDLRWSLVYSSF